MNTSLSLLAGVWLLWCLVHSLLAAPWVARPVQRRLNLGPACYRLLYNGVALLSLAPVLLWSERLPGSAILVWSGPPRVLQGLLWLSAGYLGWAGARAYTLTTFLGLGCLRSQPAEPAPRLVTDGILGQLRHPWYLAGLLLLWGRDLNPPGLVTASVLSLYLLLGAWLEERRMMILFGREYLDYRRRVPMLIPWRGLARLLAASRKRWPG